MRMQNIEVVINILDIKVTKKLMGKALAQLVNDKINRLPIEHRKEVCEKILNVDKNSVQKNAE